MEILHTGGKFGDYTVERLLGKGGMGEVWLLRAPSGGEVAAKILNPEDSADHEARRRFLREAELALGVQHPNLVETYDVGEDPETGLCYILMEYVPGGTLADRLKAGALPVREALTITYQIASVLELAHAKGIVHRDIKPANIMFGANGKAKLADLGIARGGAGVNTTTVTQTGMMIGTPAYMAPEQMLDAHAVDSRADIYSLGIVLYEMLVGRRPNADDTVVQLMAKAVSGEPIPDVRSQRPEVVAAVAELVGLMCAMKADERLSSPREVTTAISQIVHGREMTIRRKAPAVIRKKRSVPLGLVLPVVLLMAVALSASLWWLFRPPAAVPDSRQVVITNVVIQSVAVTNEVAQSVAVTNVVGAVDAGATCTVAAAADASANSAKPKGTGLPPKVLELSDGVPPLEFIGCPSGSCEVGDEIGDSRYSHGLVPRHRVTISRPFWIGKCLVSHEQWAAFDKPVELTDVVRILGGGRCAVNNVCYLTVSRAAARLTERFRDRLPEGYAIRLPTEAELAYAGLAGGADAPLVEKYRADAEGYCAQLQRRITDAGVELPKHFDMPKGEIGHGPPNSWGLLDLHAQGVFALDVVSGSPHSDSYSGAKNLNDWLQMEDRRLEKCRYGDSPIDHLTFALPTEKNELIWSLRVGSFGGRHSADVPIFHEHPGIGVRLVIAPDILKERGLTLPTRPKASSEVATKGETDRRVRVAEANGFSWCYTLEDGEAVIWRGELGYNNETRPGVSPDPQGEVFVPDRLDGHAVKAIGSQAFFRCKRMTSVTIPEGVRELRRWAFVFCDALTEVRLPASLEKIPRGTFSYCSALQTIDIGKCPSVSGEAFQSCAALDDVRVAPSNPSYVSRDGLILTRDLMTLVFYPRTRTDLVLPKDLREIGEGAFYGCRIQDLELPESVEKIGSAAFYLCRSLQHIRLGASLRTVEKRAFNLCSDLQELNFPKTLETLGDEFAGGCKSLKRIVFRGNAPRLNDTRESVFKNVSPQAEILVAHGSTGWSEPGSTELPNTWPPGGFADSLPIRHGTPDELVPPREGVAPATDQGRARMSENEGFSWSSYFTATVPMSQSLAASLKSSDRETTPEMEEKIGQMKAVLEEMKLAVEPIVNAETLFAAGRAIRDLEQLVVRFRKLKTSSTGRNRLTRWEEQNEIVRVAEAKGKLLEWLLYFAVEDRTAHVPLEKALKASQRDLKTQREKLNRMKKPEEDES